MLNRWIASINQPYCNGDPDFQTIMLPVLRLAATEKEIRVRGADERLADEFDLSDFDRNTFLPSGSQPLSTNRLGWARTYLKQAGLVESARRGYFGITDAGEALLRENPNEINIKTLERYPAFEHFRQRKRDKVEDSTVPRE